MTRKIRCLCILLVLSLSAACLSGCSSEWFKRLFGASGLVVNEICTSNASCLIDEEFGTPDWVELYNNSTQVINLSDYALSNDIESPAKFLLPDISLDPGAYLVVYFTKQKSESPQTKPSTGFKLSSGGAMVILTSSGGDTLSKIEVPALSTDQTFARNENGNYSINASATPGAMNVIVEALGGSSVNEMADNAPVTITEVLVDNGYSLVDEDGDRNGWVEIENSSSTAVSLSGYRLSDNADEPAKWAFPDITLQAGERIIVYCSGKNKVTDSGQMHASFRLGDSDVKICLLDMVNMQMQTVSLPHMAENLSYGVKDGQWVYFGQPTPGQPNNTHGVSSMEEATLFNLDGLYISEVCAAQSYKSSSLDWIELYNGGNAAISLSGYYLSDDRDNLQKAKIGNLTISAGGYAVLSVSGNINKQGGSVLEFGISSNGETLILSDPGGVPVDIFTTGVMRPGITSGRVKGDASGARVFFTSSTRGEANSSHIVEGYAAKPTFSVAGGIQAGPIAVTIQTTTPNASIYYTIDGSEPTTAGKRYEQPVTIGQSVPLRAIAVCDGLLKSDVMTATYLYTEPHTVPVVCLTMDPGDFSTMYANTKTYITIEREGHVEYYDLDGDLGTMFPAAIRVSGWSTRSLNQKSLTFKLDDAFGMDVVTYPFFEDYDINTFAALTMRSGGQDRTSTYLRDPFLARVALLDEVDADVPNNRFAVLYINGQYWGLYDLREEIAKDMLAAHHDVDPTTVNYMRRQVVQYGSNAQWQNICTYARSHNLDNEAYYEQFCEWVDVSAWADYLVLKNYFRETDMFNQKYWHTSDYSVKLRPIYFDNDYSLTSSGALSTYLISYYMSFDGFTTKNGTYVNMDVSAALWTSSQFRNLFIQRWAVLSKNVFDPDRMITLLDSMVAEMEPEMSRQISRWGAPSSLSHWRSELDEFRSLIRRRPTSAKDLLQKNFNLSNSKMTELYK